MTNIAICSIDGCGRPVVGWGWCSRHYARWKRNGDPLGGRIPDGDAQKYFHEVVIPFQGDGCLRWPYASMDSGYGVIRHLGKSVTVHRLVCETINGLPPTYRHNAAHNCGNGHLGCCNPRHLQWKTPKENHADKLVHGTDNRGEKCPVSKLKNEDVIEIVSMANKHTHMEIADMFGVTRGTIWKIINGDTWSHLTGISNNCLHSARASGGR